MHLYNTRKVIISAAPQKTYIIHACLCVWTVKIKNGESAELDIDVGHYLC